MIRIALVGAARAASVWGNPLLRIEPKGWLSWSFRVLDARGHALTEIQQAWVRERGTFSIDGTRYTVRRTSAWKGTFQLEQPEGVLAEATKPSLFRRAFDVVTPRGHLRVEATSVFGRTFEVYRDEAPVGSIRPAAFLSRSAEADLPDDLPEPIRVFLIFLVLLLWKRAANAAAS